MSERPSPSLHRRVIVVLATLLVVNPAIIFLATKSLYLATSAPLLSVVAMQLLISKRNRTLLSAYVFNALAVVSVFLHAEVLFVYGFPDYVVENLYTIEDGYYFNRPLLNETFHTKEFSVSYRTNVQGYRIADEQDALRTYTTADWVVIGDSFTQGAQVSFNELYTSHLSAAFPDKIIVNAGISGLGIGHEVNLYLHSGRLLRPDLVVLQLSSFNDFMNVEPGLVGLTDRLMSHSAFLRFLLADFKFTNPAALPLGRWTEPFHPDHQSNLDFNIFYKETSPRKRADIASFERYLTNLRDAVEEDGARLLVVLIPTKEQVHPHYLDEVLTEFSIDAGRLDMQRPNDLLARMTRDLQVELLDLLPTFRASAERPFFDYDEHLSPAGHRLMAHAIAEHLTTPEDRSPRLLSDGAFVDRYPMASQDGTLITYQSHRDGNMELFVATAGLDERRRLTFNDVDESHPMLSQDNRRLLFTEGSTESHRTRATLMNIDGSTRTRLTSGNTYSAIATFSKTNLQIAYAEWTLDESTGTFSLPQIVLLDTTSGAKRYLTPPSRESWRPVISPDDRKVYYISKPHDQFDIYEFDLASGSERRLTDTPFDEWDPQVSPEGNRLTYAARAEGNWDLFIRTLATGETLQLTRTRGDEWDPSFSHDGQSLLFAGLFGLSEAMFTLPLPPSTQ